MAENSRRWAEISRRYRTYIKLEKRLSANTVESYMRDLEQFAHFVLRMWDVPPRKVESQMIERYMAWLYDRGCEKSSQARALSGLKSFFNYLLLTDAIESSPLEFIEMPKFSRRLPDVLSTAEIDRILAAIDRTTPKGVRDDAMLELLYSCGLRVSELISLRLCDLFFGEGYIRVIGKGDKQRLVPVSDTAREKIYAYLDCRKGDALPEQSRRTAFARDDLHDHQAGRTARGYRQAGQPPHLPPLVRHASARRRRFDPAGAGDAGARKHHHDRNLHAPRQRAPARNRRTAPADLIRLRRSAPSHELRRDDRRRRDSPVRVRFLPPPSGDGPNRFPGRSCGSVFYLLRLFPCGGALRRTSRFPVSESRPTPFGAVVRRPCGGRAPDSAVRKKYPF